MKNFIAGEINEPFENKIIKCDKSSLSYFNTELYQHVLRMKYIASIWNNLQTPTGLKPEEWLFLKI